MFLGVMDSNGNSTVPVDRDGNATTGPLEENVTLMGNGHDKEGIPEETSSRDDEMPFITLLLKRHLHLLPIVTFIFIFTTFIVCYIIAVAYGHVEAFFPYISACIFSRTGIEAPERSIFSMLVNMGAFLLLSNVYIRYKHMAEVLTILTNQYSHNNKIRVPRKLNIVSLVAGVLSAIGLSVVANFQTNDMKPYHYVGAFFAFVVGDIYCWLQTAISLRFRPWAKVTVCQFINSIILTVFTSIFSISKITYSVREYHGHGTKWDTLRAVYLISTITEWLTAVAIISFVLTFYHDFKNAQLHTPRVSINDKDLMLKDYKLRLPTKEEPPQQQNSVV